MEVKFIPHADNRSAYEAESLDQLFEVGMPASVTREFGVRVGNVSGADITETITTSGQHPDRVMLSITQFGGYADTLSLSLEEGASTNLYIRLTLPATVKTETVTTYINIGNDSLPLIYGAAEAANVLFNPYPLYEGDKTETIFRTFQGKPVHRFLRYDPVDREHETLELGKKFALTSLGICSWFDPNNQEFGYQEPIVKDVVCLPTQRDIESVEQWTFMEEHVFDYSDRANIFLQPDFLAEMGNELPIWRFFHHDRIAETDYHKRTHFLMQRHGSLYHLDNLHWVQVDQEVLYVKATLRLLFDQAGASKWSYNPFAQVYEEGSDIVVRRYACVADTTIKAAASSSAGSSGGS